MWILISIARPAHFNNTYCIRGEKISCSSNKNRFSECTLTNDPNIIAFGYDTWLTCFPTETFNPLGISRKIVEN